MLPKKYLDFYGKTDKRDFAKFLLGYFLIVFVIPFAIMHLTYFISVSFFNAYAPDLGFIPFLFSALIGFLKLLFLFH